MSRSALLREGGVDVCICAEDELEGLELERATLRMRRLALLQGYSSLNVNAGR
jgi:hypothetical protein